MSVARRAPDPAATARRMEHVVETARQRVNRALAWNAEHRWVHVIPAPPAVPTMYMDAAERPASVYVGASPDAEALARRLAESILDTLKAYRGTADRLSAMGARLVPQWSVFHGFDDREMLMVETIEDRARNEGLLSERRFAWPSNVSLDDVRETIERSRDPAARVIAESMRAGLWTMDLERYGPQLRRDAYRPARYARDEHGLPDGTRVVFDVAPEEAEVYLVRDAALLSALGSRFHPQTAALVTWAEKTVVEAQRAARPFPVATTRESHAAMSFLAQPSRLSSLNAKRDVRVVWDGSREMQLTFAFAELDDVPVLTIREKLGPEGLRDWVILHRMAAEQGGTGTLTWRWEDHRRDTAHDARVRSSTRKDDDLRAEVVRRLHRLAQAELYERRERDGQWAEVRLGGQGFVAIDARAGTGPARRDRSSAMVIRLNPALYQGAKRGAKHHHYTLLPNELLRLRGHSLSLGVLLAYRWRARADDGGAVELDEAAILRLMDASPGDYRNRAKGAAMVRRALDDVAQAMGDACRWEIVEGGKVRVEPPRWWTDHTLHGAPRTLPAPQGSHPTTGTELVEWRAKHGLSQQSAAKLLGVGLATVKRAERMGPEPLPRSFARVSWAVGRALPEAR